MENRNPADFTVSRQCRWHQAGRRVVELTRGGSDYTGPDTVSAKYPGELQTFQGQVLALEAAIDVAQQWHRDQPSKDIYVDIGDNGGGIVNMVDGVLVTDESGLMQMREAAEAFDEKLEKCEQCAGFLPRERNRFKHDFVEEYVYCSERCAERAHEKYVHLEEEEDVKLV